MTEKKNGIIKIYYRTTEIKSQIKYFIFNGKREGEYKEYHENGQLKKICNYSNDKKEGKYKQYYKNGKIYIICNYKNAKIEGIYKECYENIEIEIICNFKNGERQMEHLQVIRK